jgi:hypothetical protein
MDDDGLTTPNCPRCLLRMILAGTKRKPYWRCVESAPSCSDYDTLVAMSATDWLTAIATVAAAGAAAAAWRAAVKSNDVAAQLAAIEAQRRHDEVTPSFNAALSPSPSGQWDLLVDFEGDIELDDLVISVVDDPGKPSSFLFSKDRYTDEDLRRYVWAALRFAPDVDGTDHDGRSVKVQNVAPGDGLKFLLDDSRAPGWWDDASGGWRQLRRRELHLRLDATAAQETWRVRLRLPLPALT